MVRLRGCLARISLRVVVMEETVDMAMMVFAVAVLGFGLFGRILLFRRALVSLALLTRRRRRSCVRLWMIRRRMRRLCGVVVRMRRIR